MNDPRQPEHTRSARQGPDPAEQPRQPYPPYTDPAYSGQTFYPPAYYPGPSPNPTQSNPTEKLPRYWLQGQSPPDQPTQEPEPRRPKAPRWLWIAAGAAVLLVTALVIALLLANGTARKQTAVTPLPSSQNPGSATSASPSASTPTSTESSQPTNAGAMQAVVYNVTGEGRAISITYVDNDGMMQTEFNVGLPWNKGVNLPKSGNPTANVTIVNIGHDVTCSVTVDGVQVTQRTGAGLTVCSGAN